MPLSVHILHNDRLERGEHQGKSKHSALLLLLIDINKKQKRSKR
jgi:hypothetical protein